MRHQGSCFRRAHGALAIVAALGFLSVPADGQTSFSWPDTTVDVSRYTTIEECDAAARRVAQGVASRDEFNSGNWRDTMPVDSRERLEPQSPLVVETVRRCTARFATVESAPLAYFSNLFALYLVAGWDAKAAALVERRLAAVDPKADGELTAVIDSVARIYAAGGSSLVRPARTALAEEIIAKQSSRVNRVQRLRLYLALMFHTMPEWKTTDTARVQRVVSRAVAIADSLTEPERETLKRSRPLVFDVAIDQGQSFEQQLSAIIDETSGKGALDSLRRSTAAFVALKRDRWSRMMGSPPAAFIEPIGQRAPVIQADFWVGRGNTAGPRPSPGRVSIVAILAMGASDNYARSLIPLRRLATRFPELEITVLEQSHGHFMVLKDSITPAKEAELTKRWLESFGLNGALAMTNTEYWRLPNHDTRRIDRTGANITNYTFGKTFQHSVLGSTFLVDAEGIVVEAIHSPLARDSEEDFAELIEVLLARRKANP
jgi:hypothetical protein